MGENSSCRHSLSCGWVNHGAYVGCVSKVARTFLADGLISEAERSEIIRTSARSGCGR